MENQEQKLIPETPVTPEQPIKKQKPKWIVPAIIIAGIIILGIATLVIFTDCCGSRKKAQEAYNVYIQEEESDETAGWEVYRNEEYGFEFKYPNDWTMGVDVNKSEPKKILVSPEDSQGKKYTFGINIEDNPNKFNASEWLDDYVNVSLTKLNLQRSKKQFGTLIGEEVIGFPWVVDVLTFFTARDDKIFNFYLMPYYKSEIPQEIVTTYHQILSTFKFIESDETANWKIYRNEEYGFEFKYPIENVSLGSLVFTESYAGCQNTAGGKCNNPSRYIVGVSRCFTIGGFSCDDSSGFSVEVFFDLNEFTGIQNRWNTGAKTGIKMLDVQVGEVWGKMVSDIVDGAQNITYFMQVDSYGFVISVNNVSNQGVPIDEMTEIFSTFKFLD